MDTCTETFTEVTKLATSIQELAYDTADKCASGAVTMGMNTAMAQALSIKTAAEGALPTFEGILLFLRSLVCRMSDWCA